MFRQFRRDRLFHAVIVILLGLGIGANTLVFSLVNEVLLKPLPVRDPWSLFLLERIQPMQVRPDTYFRYRHLAAIEANPMLSAVIAEQFVDQRALVRISQGGGVRLITAQVVSPNYFRELGLRAAVGRCPTPPMPPNRPIRPRSSAISSGSRSSAGIALSWAA